MAFAASSLFDILLPRICPGCDCKLTAEERFVCNECLNKIQMVNSERLHFNFTKIFISKKFVSGFAVLYHFEKDKELQKIIHALKYKQKFLLGIFLGEMLGQTYQNLFKDWKLSLILPVPLHHLKKAERGYNQSQFIAKGMNKVLGTDAKVNILRRERFTQSQTHLNQHEREENVCGAFGVKNPKYITGKSILVIDDVITTGATINECAKVLLDNGALKVYSASVAIAD